MWAPEFVLMLPTSQPEVFQAILQAGGIQVALLGLRLFYLPWRLLVLFVELCEHNMKVAPPASRAATTAKLIKL